MGRLARSRSHHKNKEVHRAARVRHRVKAHLDQILDDLKPENVDKLTTQPISMDLPGLGQFYCVACARYFIDELSLNVHFKSKVHRRRLKELKEPAYTQEDAEAAAGMSTTLTSRSNAAGASGSGTTSTAASSSAPAPTATSMDA